MIDPRDHADPDLFARFLADQYSRWLKGEGQRFFELMARAVDANDADAIAGHGATVAEIGAEYKRLDDATKWEGDAAEWLRNTVKKLAEMDPKNG